MLLKFILVNFIASPISLFYLYICSMPPIYIRGRRVIFRLFGIISKIILYLSSTFFGYTKWLFYFCRLK